MEVPRLETAVTWQYLNLSNNMAHAHSVHLWMSLLAIGKGTVGHYTIGLTLYSDMAHVQSVLRPGFVFNFKKCYLYIVVSAMMPSKALIQKLLWILTLYKLCMYWVNLILNYNLCICHWFFWNYLEKSFKLCMVNHIDIYIISIFMTLTEVKV